MILSCTQRRSVTYYQYLRKFWDMRSKYFGPVGKEQLVLWKEVKWCGRFMDSISYHMDPRNIESIRNLKHHRTTDDICQVIHFCRWMSTRIPIFHRQKSPLSHLIEKAYMHLGREKTGIELNIIALPFLGLISCSCPAQLTKSFMKCCRAFLSNTGIRQMHLYRCIINTLGKCHHTNRSWETVQSSGTPTTWAHVVFGRTLQ